MKIIAKKLNKKLVVVQVENLDDLWTIYNIIAVGDYLEGKTSRRIILTDRPDDKGERRYIFLKISVESIEFHEFSNRLRVKGKIVEGPEDLVTLNTYHTFNVEENSRIGITKERWTRYLLNLLEDTAKRKNVQKILVIAIDVGEAQFGEIGDYYQKTSVKVSERIPGKRYGDIKESKNARNSFFSEVYKQMLDFMKKTKYTKIIIAGPGFVREQFFNYCVQKDPSLKSLLFSEAVSTATVSGIYELIKKKTIQNILKDSRIVKESILVDEFFTRLGKSSGDIAYGLNEVKKANDIGAIEDLLITDEIMRTINANENKELTALMREVERNRGKIHILSTLHDAGKKIKGIGGVVALLRFKLQY
ncbi:MAG: mRNA surveillance protein pelota [Promethearchaeota archaeon]